MCLFFVGFGVVALIIFRYSYHVNFALVNGVFFSYCLLDVPFDVRFHFYGRAFCVGVCEVIFNVLLEFAGVCEVGHYRDGLSIYSYVE